MKILVSYRAIPQSPGWATGDMVIRALRELGHDARPYAKLYNRDQWLGREIGKPDLHISMEMNDRDVQYGELLKLNCARVHWDFDTELHADFTASLADRFDYMFLANPHYLKRIPKSFYLPYGVDQELYQAHPRKKEGAAIIGSSFPQRMAFAHKVGIPLITGPHRREYMNAIGALKVHVHNYSSGGEGLLVYRIWETLGVGTCLLTEKSETLDRHFKDGKHLVCYRDHLDCEQAIAWLLRDDVAREEIALAGHVEAMEKHTYKHRMIEMLNTLGMK